MPVERTREVMMQYWEYDKQNEKHNNYAKIMSRIATTYERKNSLSV